MIKNIVFDATIFEQSFTGIARSTLNLYRAASNIIPILNFNGVHQKELFAELSTPVIAKQRYFPIPSKIWRSYFLTKYINQSATPFVHFPYNGSVPAVFPNKIIITSLYDVLPLEMQGYFKNDEEEDNYRKKIAKDLLLSDIIITSSEYSKRKINLNFKPNKDIHVISLGSGLEEYLLKPKFEKDNNLGKYFIYYGGYDKRKGLDQLVKRFISIHKSGLITEKLILIGKPHYFSSDFKKSVKEGVDAGIIKELGYISDHELVFYIRNALALIYPSKYEGFGLPPLEAMSFGCPVITAPFSSVLEVCGHDSVLYADPDVQGELESAIHVLSSSFDLRENFAAKGRKRAQEFTWHKAANSFLNLIEKEKSSTNKKIYRYS